MRLQDFLGTNTRYDIQQIDDDEALSRQIQTRLIDLGLLDPPVDGIFGPLSTAAFKRFQELMNISESGILATETAQKLLDTTTMRPPNMRLEDFLGTNIRYEIKAIYDNERLSRQIQTRLIDLGLLEPPVDGIFGPLSTAAFRRFQELMNISESGILGSETAKKLIETTTIRRENMRLQDFVGTNIRYDFQAIYDNEALSRQIQIRLIDLGLLAPPVDGIFGPLSRAAFRNFQELMNCSEPSGILGTDTAKKLIETKTVSRPGNMRLQDFLGTNLRYDVKAINADAGLSRQIQIRLIDLGLLDPPADGIFGPKSTAALHRFQQLMECSEPGFIGSETAKKLIETKVSDLPVTTPILKVIRNTVFKVRPIASSQLNNSEKFSIPAGREFSVLAYDPIRAHLRVALRNESFGGYSILYIWAGHVEVYEGGTRTHPRPLPTSRRLNVPFKSQLDNFYNPTGACNVTSIAMCLAYFNIPRRNLRYRQFEDELYRYALDMGYSRHNPYDLARIVRDYGARDHFTENAVIEDVQDWIAAGYPAVIHGYFTSFGHIIVVVGYDQNGFIVHDPYGEWFSTGYRTDLSGAYLHYSYRLIRRVCIPDGNFWVHFISR
ncbi:MAG: peptidoglycan-binding protein [Limnospira indica BM01]|nr:MAG: peptidoglycan-binding protein [Limnospira indica BM01]